MSVVEQEFFVAGGALQNSAPSYVARVADRELYEALVRGEFCYVLTPRQMGKSSLMVRTAGRLQDAGVTVAVLDLTAIGQNLDLEKWYSGLIAILGQQLDMEDELDDYWWNNQQLGPLQRWMAAIRHVVLPRCSKLVVFVDEIDVVRSLPFSTDEFFAGIRSCYNHRSDDEAFCDLTFCLLGVATPSDLIQDTRMTPFNIGRRIELHDFTEEDAAVLAEGLSAEGLSSGQEMLRRVLYWTGGHPYLTQRLCRSVAKAPDARRPADVDRICGAVFLSQAARQQDSNLLFVQQRILRSDSDLAGLLEEYDRIHRQRRVRNDERSEIHSILGLSGIVRNRDGFLEVRNEIYRHVYDRDWIKGNMPDAELRRQRAAFRKGLLRASGVAAVVILILAALASLAFNQWRAAERQHAIAQEALRKERIALEQARHARKSAETERATAQELQKAAENARKSAESERKVAELALEEKEQALAQREQALSAAKAAEQAAEVAALKATREAENAAAAQRRAETERARAEQNAERATRREALFGELLPLLEEHAAKGVLRHALDLQEKGQREEAFSGFVEFADLALGETEGFLALELFDPLNVSDLQSESIEKMRISVPADSLYQDVLEPAIALGESLLDRPGAKGAIRQQLATLYNARGQLLKQNLDAGWTADLNAEQIIFASYDRAAELQSDQFSHFVERAVARYRLPDRNLADVLKDVERAIQLYPQPPEPAAPAAGARSLTTAHRELGELRHAQGNLLEQLARNGSVSQRLSLLERAEQSHRQAESLDPANARYQLGTARALRKQAVLRTSAPESGRMLTRAEALLSKVLASDQHLAEAHNELGQIYLLQGRVTEARTSFEAAIRSAEKANRKSSLYAYLCSLANAHTRAPASAATFRQAQQAAERAISLQTNPPPIEGHYYRGLALWQLGETGEALEAFAQVLRFDADHADALLAKAQIVFEESASPQSAVEKAQRDVRRLLSSADLELAQRATAHYIYSVAYLRHFNRSKIEKSLLDALKQLVKAVTNSRSYEAHARRAFEQAAIHSWQDPQLNQEFLRVYRQFNELVGR